MCTLATSFSQIPFNNTQEGSSSWQPVRDKKLLDSWSGPSSGLTWKRLAQNTQFGVSFFVQKIGESPAGYHSMFWTRKHGLYRFLLGWGSGSDSRSKSARNMERLPSCKPQF